MDERRGSEQTDFDSLPRLLGDIDGNGAHDIVGFTNDGPLISQATPDNDIFVFSGTFGTDRITDFEAGNAAEKIDLSGVGPIADYTDLMTNHLSQSGPDALIDDHGGNTITLETTQIGDLTEDNFIF